MSKFCVGENFSEELTCAICLDSWKNPVELQDCKHVFCRECIGRLHECPQCREPIKSASAPNRALVNLSLQVETKCIQCGWRGTREKSETHVCSGKLGGKSPANTTAPIGGVHHPPFVTPHAAPSNSPSTNIYDAPYFNLCAGSSAAPTPHAPAQSNYAVATPPAPKVDSSKFTNGYQTPPPALRENGIVIHPTGPTPWKLYGMTQDEYDQIVSLFMFFDTDEGGTLSRANIMQLSRWLNFARTDDEINRIITQMDVSRRGRVTLPEFLTWLRYNKPNPQSLYGLSQSEYNTIMMQFHMYDRDRSGWLNENEFTRLVVHIGDVKNAQTAHNLFRMIDVNRDGKVTLHEFLKFRLSHRNST